MRRCNGLFYGGKGRKGCSGVQWRQTRMRERGWKVVGGDGMRFLYYKWHLLARKTSYKKTHVHVRTSFLWFLMLLLLLLLPPFMVIPISAFFFFWHSTFL
uniref:Uncharacterized protein n=1 Tax=Trypanosoma vivax (strain Y486) TaxID=1055687 RepID=G0U2P3_TRYVY|nr:hypothetical protein TVY486_0903670 [Trypanosoma vivax Y486]